METKGFFASLFDIDFKSLVITRVIKVLYVLIIIVLGLGTLVLIASAFADSATTGVVALIFAPLVFLVYLIFARIYLEILIVVFRIYENTNRMVGNSPQQGVAPGPNASPPLPPPGPENATG